MTERFIAFKQHKTYYKRSMFRLLKKKKTPPVSTESKDTSIIIGTPSTIRLFNFFLKSFTIHRSVGSPKDQTYITTRHLHKLYKTP